MVRFNDSYYIIIIDDDDDDEKWFENNYYLPINLSATTVGIFSWLNNIPYPVYFQKLRLYT